MTTNKTPIQGLIDYFEDQNSEEYYAIASEAVKDVIYKLKEYKQREKSFAFDCFKAGDFMHGCDTIAAFDQFYCKYVE